MYGIDGLMYAVDGMMYGKPRSDVRRACQNRRVFHRPSPQSAWSILRNVFVRSARTEVRRCRQHRGAKQPYFGKLSRCEVRSFCQSCPDPCTAPLSQRGGPKYGAFDTDSDGAAKKVADRHGPKYAKVVTTPGFRSVQMVATRACGAACATREPACRAPGSGRSPAAGPAWRQRRSLGRLDGTCAAAAW